MPAAALMPVYLRLSQEMCIRDSLEALQLPTEADDEDVANELTNMLDRNSRLVTVEDLSLIHIWQRRSRRSYGTAAAPGWN